jgi:hypothetical protein
MLQRRLYFSKPELRDSLHYAYMRPKSFDVRKGQTRRFDRQPVTSDLPQSTDII